MSRKSKSVPKDGAIYHDGETKINKTAAGIVGLSKERQIHTLKEVETPELLKAIVEMTTHIEVKKLAEANPNYPHNQTTGRSSIVSYH
jgi:hypothetical protein